MTVNLFDYDLEGLTAFCESCGEKPFRAVQLFRWIHQHGVTDFAQMTNLAKSFQQKLLAKKAIIQPLTVLQKQESSDGTIKWLFDVGEGNAIESVFIPEADRATLCISSQVGCAVGCRFCSTGHQGFSRNLSTAEIVSQLWSVEFFLRQQKGLSTRMITNVVMMGMGEPLQNYHALIPALRTFLSDHAYGLSRRRVTVSTSGMVPMIDRLAQDCPVALAVSLHASHDELRSQLIPLNRKYPLSALLAACHRYIPHGPRDFITFEYCMLDAVNDRLEDAHQLIQAVQSASVACKVNLIPFNPFKGSVFRASSREKIQQFAHVLQQAGMVTTIRKTRGDDIVAACGQLAGEVSDRTEVWRRIEKYSAFENASSRFNVPMIP